MEGILLSKLYDMYVELVHIRYATQSFYVAIQGVFLTLRLN